jgi:hypothetical protein
MVIKLAAYKISNIVIDNHDIGARLKSLWWFDRRIDKILQSVYNWYMAQNLDVR